MVVSDYSFAQVEILTKRISLHIEAKAALTVIRAATEVGSVCTSSWSSRTGIKRLIQCAIVAELWKVAVAQGITTLVQDGVQQFWMVGLATAK